MSFEDYNKEVAAIHEEVKKGALTPEQGRNKILASMKRNGIDANSIKAKAKEGVKSAGKGLLKAWDTTNQGALGIVDNVFGISAPVVAAKDAVVSSLKGGSTTGSLMGDVAAAGAAGVHAAKNPPQPQDTAKPGDGKDPTPQTPPAEANADGSVIPQVSVGGGGGGIDVSKYKKDLDKHLEGDLNDPIRKTQGLIKDAGDLEYNQGKEIEAGINKITVDAQAKQQEDLAKAAQDDMWYEQKMMALEQESNELAKSSLDDKRWWNNASTPEKIFLAIGGVLASGFAKKDLIQKTIDKDLALQQAEYERKGDNLKRKDGIYARMAAHFSNKHAAMAAARAEAFSLAKTQIDAIAARHGGEKARARAKIETAKLDEQIGENRFKAWESVTPNPYGHTGGIGGGSGGHGSSSLGITDQDDRVFKTADGGYNIANSAFEAKRLQGVGDFYFKAKNAYDEMEQLLITKGGEVLIPGTVARTRYEELVANLTLDKKGTENGMSSDKDFVALASAVGVPRTSNVIAGNALEIIRNSRARMQGTYRTVINNSGSQRAMPVMVYDPKKRVNVRTLVPVGQETKLPDAQEAPKAGQPRERKT